MTFSKLYEATIEALLSYHQIKTKIDADMSELAKCWIYFAMFVENVSRWITVLLFVSDLLRIRFEAESKTFLVPLKQNLTSWEEEENPFTPLSTGRAIQR